MTENMRHDYKPTKYPLNHPLKPAPLLTICLYHKKPLTLKIKKDVSNTS